MKTRSFSSRSQQKSLPSDTDHTPPFQASHADAGNLRVSPEPTRLSSSRLSGPPADEDGAQRNDRERTDANVAPPACAISVDRRGQLRMHTPKLLPWVLHRLLDDAEQYGFTHIVSWMPSGRVFKVHDQKAFEMHVMGRYFRKPNYRNLVRSLNIWGFAACQVCCGKALYHGYFHRHFVRGKPKLAYKMTRRGVKNVKKSAGCRHCECRKEEGADFDLCMHNSPPKAPTQPNGAYVRRCDASLQQNALPAVTGVPRGPYLSGTAMVMQAASSTTAPLAPYAMEYLCSAPDQSSHQPPNLATQAIMGFANFQNSERLALDMAQKIAQERSRRQRWLTSMRQALSQYVRVPAADAGAAVLISSALSSMSTDSRHPSMCGSSSSTTDSAPTSIWEPPRLQATQKPSPTYKTVSLATASTAIGDQPISNNHSMDADRHDRDELQRAQNSDSFEASVAAILQLPTLGEEGVLDDLSLINIDDDDNSRRSDDNNRSNNDNNGNDEADDDSNNNDDDDTSSDDVGRGDKL